jgi:hypothetical protein
VTCGVAWVLCKCRQVRSLCLFLLGCFIDWCFYKISVGLYLDRNGSLGFEQLKEALFECPEQIFYPIPIFHGL